MSSTGNPQAGVPRRGLLHLAGRVLVTALCVTAAIAIWALVTGHFDTTEGRVLGTTLVAAILTLAGLGGATVLDRSGIHRRIGQGTVVLSAADLGLAAFAIWSPVPSHTLLKALAVVSLLLPALVHASLMLAGARQSDPSYLRGLARIAIAFASTGAVMAAVATAFVTGRIDPGFWRAFGVVVVLATLATLLTPILRRMKPGGPQARNRTQTARATKDDLGKGPSIRLSVPPPGTAGGKL